MEHKQSGSTAMRVSIVSVSRNQREHLKRLIEQHGPRVVGMSGFRDYILPRDEQYPDVLLVDLDDADDASLTRIEGLLEQSNVPVLFNESTAVPTAPGPYRDDWVDNLVGKLYILATQRSLIAKAGLSERPRYAQTVDYSLPNVLIVSHSKTRRRVLQIILAAQGIRDSTETAFESKFIAERIEHYDALLVDEHNVSPDEQKILSQLTSQTQVPVQVCNSSTVPYSGLARRQWGIQLAAKIIKSSKLKTNASPVTTVTRESLRTPITVPANQFIAVNGEHEWGSRLSEVLSQVRTNLIHQATPAKVSKAAPPKAPKSAAPEPIRSPVQQTPVASQAVDVVGCDEQPSLVSDSSNMPQIKQLAVEAKLNEASTPEIIAKQRNVAHINKTNPKQPTTQAANPPATTKSVITPIRAATNTAGAVRKAEPTQKKKAILSSDDLIDATNLDSLPVTPPPKMKSAKPAEPLQNDDARDTEIERFFDFDKELDISQTRHPLGEGHVLNSTTHDEILPWSIEDELTNPFSKHASNKKAAARTQKKSRSLWRDSL
ncbi:MAG: hypothetical protein HY273_13560, partial [Gammaproteobacteria bacterium]|nr:hypothetical protein [Gammaproteobacteria bacterium]